MDHEAAINEALSRHCVVRLVRYSCGHPDVVICPRGYEAKQDASYHQTLCYRCEAASAKKTRRRGKAFHLGNKGGGEG